MLPPNFVNEHKIVNEKDARALAKSYGISLELFPKIGDSDPQVKLIGAKPGQLIEIQGSDSKKPYYRYVIKG